MYMSMVVVADCRNVTSSISINRWFIVSMVVTVLVAMMPEMCGMARRAFQRIADTHHRRVCGVH